MGMDMGIVNAQQVRRRNNCTIYRRLPAGVTPRDAILRTSHSSRCLERFEQSGHISCLKDVDYQSASAVCSGAFVIWQPGDS
jgi:hypothetical protein